jgi:type II secretory pathway component PulF
MKEFRYRALSSTGHTVTGIRTAEDATHLSQALLEQGLVLLRSRPTRAS